MTMGDKTSQREARHGTADRHPPRSAPAQLSALALALLALALALPLAACSPRAGPSPCIDGSQRCAAATAAPGSRSLRRGHRIRRYRWIPKTNRESGGADVGLQADWEPTHQRP
ncbi:MAG: hypothetical protein VKN13_07480 [Cyanobacteriota bacterium]|nr:hypothetical protein [Cyanobacteriota bacterium]